MWHYIYILQNERGQQYVGLTDDVDDRLARHNRGEIPSTAKIRPWTLLHFAAFPTREKAAAYEKYLKSGSGTTFRQRHLVSSHETRF
ncbi:MAG: GIY-YIG nuclease family protein [Candidatus Peregrinibacteria bacterium]